MKKVFLSVPMKGRTKEDIESSLAKMKAVASAYLLGEDVEFINTFVEEKPPYEMDPNHNAVWYLGASLQKLAECDLVVNLDCRWNYAGCRIENDVAAAYGIPVLQLDTALVAPDVWRKEYLGEVEECRCEPLNCDSVLKGGND